MSEAQLQYDRAMRDIKAGLTANQGGGKAETIAATAYQQMVRDGDVSQIRRKYRNGKHLKVVR